MHTNPPPPPPPPSSLPAPPPLLLQTPENPKKSQKGSTPHPTAENPQFTTPKNKFTMYTTLYHASTAAPQAEYSICDCIFLYISTLTSRRDHINE